MYSVTRETTENMIIPISITLLRKHWNKLIQLLKKNSFVQEQFALAPKEIVIVVVNYR
jgi:hypothetical protein